MSKSLLEVVHETAKDLEDIGVIDKATMREFDELCLPNVEPLTAKEIRTLREANHMSQGVFAAHLNTSKSTVQKWEQGIKRPHGPSLKLLHLVKVHGVEILQ